MRVALAEATGTADAAKALATSIRNEWLTIGARSLGVRMPVDPLFPARQGEAFVLHCRGERNLAIAHALDITPLEASQHVCGAMARWGARTHLHSVAIAHVSALVRSGQR
jgi:DNA-binding NarL/FixJ family response regulator